MKRFSGLKVSRLWMVLIFMAILSPLGLIVPDYLNAGSAWGEWSSDEVKQMLGYEPKGLKFYSQKWQGFLPDYSLPENNQVTIYRAENSLLGQCLSYIFSGFIGLLACSGVMMLLTKSFKKS